jgi:tetratricopeptide (TPR) repeat protein
MRILPKMDALRDRFLAISLRVYPHILLKTCAALLPFVFVFCTQVSVRAEDPASTFLKAYTEFQNGERLEQTGDYDKALSKYRFAASLLEQISRSDPQWQPMVVQYRLRKITEAIGRVEGLSASTGGTLPSDMDFPEGELPAFDESPSTSRPSTGRTLTPPSIEDMPANLGRVAAREDLATAQELNRLRNENKQLREQLARRTAELKSARHQVDKTLVTVVELRHELMQAKTKLQDALKDADSVKKLREDFAKQLKQISEEMEKTRAERDVLAEENEKLLAKLEHAAKYIAASDEIRKNLEIERNAFFAENNELRADRDKIQGEFESLLGELKSSRERLGELEILAKENKTLKDTLAKTNEQIAGLQEQLKAASALEIEKLKQQHAAEIAAREERIRLLESEVKAEREKLASSQGSDPEAESRLKSALEKIKELETQNAETHVLRDKLAEAEEQLAKAREAVADVAELQRQLAEARERLAEAQAANPQIKEIQDKLSEAQRQLAEAKQAQKETSSLQEKLAAVEKELASAIESNKEIKILRDKLAETEKRLKEAETKKPVNDEAILALQTELNTVNDRLFALRRELAARDTRIADLEKQLDETAGELAKLRLSPESNPEVIKARSEIELLRNIILRQLKEQARRDQARRLIEEEIAKLETQSETLKENLSILGAPMNITDEERALFRLPVAVIEKSDTASSMEASIAITKPNTIAPADKTSSSSVGEKEQKPAKPLDFKDLPKKLQELANKAQKQFEEGDLTSAEKAFLEIAQAEPQNPYAFTQLAATQVQLGKFKAAEIALNRALELNPEDAFANSILGVVYYRQNRLQEAENILRKAIKLDPNKARSYNYLGVVVGQKGKYGEAEEMLQKAIELDPKYAEAHFNLAVIYATQEPPSKELAKQHYHTALTLGAEPDPSLQRLIY